MIKLDINVGEILLGGRFLNKRVIVKDIGTNQHNQPTINGRPILKFRIEKLMTKKEVKEMKINRLRQLIREEVTNIVKHARKELKLANYNVDNSKFDYGDAIGKSALEMIETFSKAHHSGFSAAAAIAVFNKLVKFENLTELTSNTNEWNDVSGMSGRPFWQNRRNPAVFSEDGGKTWYNIDDDKTINEARNQVVVRLLIREALGANYPKGVTK